MDSQKKPLEENAGLKDQLAKLAMELAHRNRELQIETALENVRLLAGAMRSSSDLGEASAVLYQQLHKLGIQAIRSAVGIFDDPNEAMELWLTSLDDRGEMVGMLYYMNLSIHPVFANIIPARQEQKPYSLTTLSGNDLKLYYQTVSTYLSVPRQKLNHETEYFYSFFFTGGTINVVASEPLTEEQCRIMIRFAQVFGLIFTRFQDLQKAERNAREAQIESALERVRARALAMQQPEELDDVARFFRDEMSLLGVEELETCHLFIHDEKTRKSECWYAFPDSRTADGKIVTDRFSLDLNETWVGRAMLAFYHGATKEKSITMTGEKHKAWIQYCASRCPAFHRFYSGEIPDRTYHLYKFSHGAIGLSDASVISHESWNLLKRAASVFSLAYSRFTDLTQARIDLHNLKEEKSRAEKALMELRATQKQLIQSEKMALLGELTAGIAHEILNPLNFVNNFSEINTELLAELLQEAKLGRTKEVVTLAEDIGQNQNKITHHGRRADSIVQGMLQHARKGAGTKEPVALNEMVDEYLRLSYQGHRAKYQTFHVALHTDLEVQTDVIHVIPQDMGRVLVNLYNNAFYAVFQKRKLLVGNYEPTVAVCTRKEENAFRIIVRDNGTGMPPNVMEKIFQPFFTTKPAGEGTGLGLSLTYDIVTKGHGGQLLVQSTEGEGSEFTVVLPA